MTIATIPFSWMERHTAGAVRQGLSLDTLLTNSLIDLHYGDDRDLITPAQAALLCMNTVLATEDGAHGLGRLPIGVAYAAIGMRMALGCANLEGAIQAIARLYALASDSVHFQLRTDDEIASLSVHMDTTDDRDIAYLEEVFLLWIFMQLLTFLGRPPPIQEVTLRDPFHFNMGRRHWSLNAPVNRGDVTAFRFHRRLLAEPPRRRAGDNVMWDCHAFYFDYLDGRMAAAETLDLGTANGFIRFSDMVRDAGVSPNTLRRHLQSSGGGFRESRQRALVDAASTRLAESDESVEAIACELGYSDARSFRRFLKNATGLTPQQLRARQRVEEPGVDDRVRLQLQMLSQRMNM